MFESGFAVFTGMLLLIWKLPTRWLLRLLAYDLALDLTVSLVVFLMHLGTFSGVMAATIAGLLTSVATSLMKRCFGYIKGGKHYPGLFHVPV